MRDNTDHYSGALLEDISHKLDAILEGEDSLAAIGRQLHRVDERLTNLEDTVNITIKTALKGHEQLMRDHEQGMREQRRLLDNHDRRLLKLELAR